MPGTPGVAAFCTRRARAGRMHARADAAPMPGPLDACGRASGRAAAASAARGETGRGISGKPGKGGCASDPWIVWWEKTGLARFFGRLFADPDYAFLSPGARGRTGGGSLSVGFAGEEGDPREGWLDAPGRLLINKQHPLFRKYSSVPAARRQRVLVVATTVLLKNAASKKAMGAEEALDMLSRVLTMAEVAR